MGNQESLSSRLNLQYTQLTSKEHKKYNRRQAFIVCNPRAFSKECDNFIRVGNPQLILAVDICICYELDKKEGTAITQTQKDQHPKTF